MAEDSNNNKGTFGIFTSIGIICAFILVFKWMDESKSAKLPEPKVVSAKFKASLLSTPSYIVDVKNLNNNPGEVRLIVNYFKDGEMLAYKSWEHQFHLSGNEESTQIVSLSGYKFKDAFASKFDVKAMPVE